MRPAMNAVLLQGAVIKVRYVDEGGDCEMASVIMTLLLYAAVCVVWLFGRSEGRKTYTMTTHSSDDTKRLQMDRYNLPSVQREKEVALSVHSCDEVTVLFSHVDVNVYQNIFAVTLGSNIIRIKSGHNIHQLKQEYVTRRQIDMCQRSSVLKFCWEDDKMKIFKQCNTTLFIAEMQRRANPIRFVTVVSKQKAVWKYGEVCKDPHFTPPLPKNHIIKEVHTSRSIGYLPLSPDGINMSPSMTFKVKGCGKLSLAFHNLNRMAFAIRRHEIQIDNRAAYSVTTTIATGYGSTFKGLRVLKNGRMQQGNRCSDFRTFRVNYSGNTLLFEGCDLRNETLLRLSAPDLAMHQYMSAFSENQADWVFGCVHNFMYDCT
ncbi:uncharacterized protein LOC124147496 [Haliotis rufescens]|uniref:uncharacterized protein LOC124147496 n=1 Tax=Haliotis rufescens TaxID=6454 RepID=UPI00201F02D7|nr:uncharacterized protein LOC124147496 [Haliotis rufescens]